MLSIRFNRGIKLRKNKKDPRKMIKIKPFSNKYDCEGINFSSEKDG